MADKKINKNQVRVIVLRTAGTNCDVETAYAFEHFGAQADLVHINRLFGHEVALKDYHILAIPGGFTYGDDIISGRILANELRLRLSDALRRFHDDGKLMLGICNGFQVLVRAGLLPGDVDAASRRFEQTATLTYNDSGKFEDRWTYLSVSDQSVWTQGMNGAVYFPVAHAEGKFMPQNENLLRRLQDNGQVIFRYCTQEGEEPQYPANPNGSVDHIAGIADKSGRVLGLMPHPERHFFTYHHPRWTRRTTNMSLGDGAKVFENGVTYVRQNLI